MALCPGPTETGFFDASKINADVKKTMMQKGMQTPEQVVEAAMNAVKSGKTQAISGWLNYFIARSVNVIPDSLITRAVGSQLRPKFQDEKEK